MDQVCIVDSDALHAADLQCSLKSAGYEVTVYADTKDGMEIIKENRPDLVVVVPRSPVALDKALSSLSAAVTHLERRPEILFLLRWKPRGPAERLLGDRWNVQVLYER